MRTIYTKITLFLAVTALYFSINACTPSSTDSDISTVQDNAQAESESDYIQTAADASVALSTKGAQPESGSLTLPYAISISYANNDTATGPKIMTITFNGTQCPDYKTRSGNIIVTWTGQYRDSNTVAHIYTQNYVVDGNTHTFSKWITNLGRTIYNGALVPSFKVIDTATITFSSTASTIKWTSLKTREWTSGNNYLWWEYWNTGYSLTGTAKGVDRNDISYTVTITNPIVVNPNCNWVIDEGTYDVMPYGKSLRVVDYGNGTCGGNATCTIDGVVYTFMFSNY